MRRPFSGKPLVGPMPSKIQRPIHVPDVGRLQGLFFAVMLMMVVIVGRLWYLQIAMGSSFMEDAEKQRKRPIRRVAARGLIVDTRGRILATNKTEYVVNVYPEEIQKNEKAIPLLAAILNISPESLMQKLTDPEPVNPPPVTRKSRRKSAKPRGPRWKQNSGEPIEVAEKVDLRVVTQIEEQKLDLDGVEVSKQPVRYYTDDKLCTHILGLTHPIPPDKLKEYKSKGYHNNDVIGADGLEKIYEPQLRGADGSLIVAVNARNRMLHHISESNPTPGNTLKLTIDMDLQRAAYMALQDTLANGHPGSAVALDPSTGAVLAMVSTPSYDLNTYNKQFKQLNTDPMRPLYNRAIKGAYACGSTFKLITSAAGLSSGKITPYSTIGCRGSLRVGNRTFKCDGFHGTIPFETAIGKSCDVYFYTVGEAVGQRGMEAWARRFGLGAKTEIDLPSEHIGIVPSPEYKARMHLDRWQRGDTVNMSIGQGFVAVTPLQLANYTSALANGGTLWKPRLVKEIRTSSGELVSTLHPEKHGELGLKPEFRDAIVRGMRRVVEPGGTAPNAAVPGLEIAGKTGTAQTAGQDNSVFVCFAPVDHPKIAIAVLIQNVGHGSEFAAPVARKMLMQFFGRHEEQASAPRRRTRG